MSLKKIVQMQEHFISCNNHNISKIITTFGKISRKRNITHKYDKHVPLMCALGSNGLRFICPKTLKKVIQGQHHDML